MAQEIKIMNGQNGGERVANTTQRNGDFSALYCEQDTTIETLTGGFTGATGVNIPAGTWIYGIFTAVKLTSGVVHLYNR